MQIQAIIETAIYVDDLDATERFYRDIFGLRVIAKEHGRHVFFQVGTSSVLLAFIAETTLHSDENRELRPGMKGSAKVIGPHMSGFWLVARKPFNTTRRFLGW